MTMTDEILEELWAAKDQIAREHAFDIDGLAEYFLQKQSSRPGRYRRDERDLKAEQGAPADACTSRG
jgi:hypothetical protein